MFAFSTEHSLSDVDLKSSHRPIFNESSIFISCLGYQDTREHANTVNYLFAIK